ncbi:MAG TPA: hypothetical protein VIE65_14690 [Methylobacter sp.]
MKIIVASILSMIAINAIAQPVTDSNTVTITAKGPVIVLPARTQAMSPGEFGQFAGSYELANGNSIALFSRGLKKYAALHGEAWHELVAVAGNSFVAKDRQLKVTLDRNDDGEVSGGEVFIVVPADRISKNSPRKQQVQSVAMR